MNNKLKILLIVGVSLGVGCTKNTEDLTVGPDTGGEENPIENVSYATQVQPIFNASCTGCHGSSGGVKLTSFATLMSSSGNQYGDQVVVPGNAAASGLVDKLGPSPEHGVRMPQGGALTAIEIETISVWINEGAQNNQGKTMKKLTILCLLMLATTATFGQSFYTETGTAVFYSKVPLHDFEGRSENLTGLINLEDNSVDFYLDLATLDTGNGKRDKDMRLTLETEEFPFGEFTGKLSGFSLEKGTKQEVTVNGVFKIHGKEQKMEAKGTLKPVGDTLVLNASWKLMLKDYEIVPPQVLFLKVDQEQEIEITAVLTIKE